MLQLRLLGSPEISLGEQVVTEALAAKAQAILYYLAVTGQPQPRSTLAALLWGDAPDETARTNLRKALANLRQVLGDYLDLDGQTIAFKTTPWVDVTEFQVSCAKFQVAKGAQSASSKFQVSRVKDQVDFLPDTRRLTRDTPTLDTSHLIPDTPAPDTPTLDTLRQAVDLYRGDFLSGYYVRHAPDFETWMLAEQARLREMVIQTLHTLAEHLARQGELPDAIAVIRRLLSLEPWREEAHRQLMRLLAQNGQRSAALAQFEICRQALADELGVEPGPETRALYQQLRAGELSTLCTPSAGAGGQGGRGERLTPAPPPPHSSALRHNLPPQSTPFIGREQELRDIIRRLMDKDCRLLTLVGMGGIGKTRLALQTAQTIVDLDPEATLFPHGIYFIPLAAVSSTSGLIAAIAEVANFTFYGNLPPKQQLLDYLRDKEMLLLLDNFEQLLESVDLVAEILSAAPGVKILVTSREALNLQEAWYHPLAGLSFPTSALPGEGVEQYDAVQLFAQSARRARVGFSLAAEQTHVIRICQLVEGMPLGIELAAAWLKMLPAEKLAAEIEHNLDILSTRLQNIPERQRSMRAVFEYSWQRLAEEERETLKRLSVFCAGFQQEAAEQVADTSLIILATLVEKSLVQVTERGRYQMHELLRQFAAEKLAQTPAAVEETLDAHCRYYAKFLSDRELWKLPSSQWLTVWGELGVEFDNLRACWQRAIAPGRKVAVAELNQAIWLVSSLHIWRGWFQEGLALLEQAAARLEEEQSSVPFDPLQKLVYGRVLLGQGHFCYFLGHFEQAIRLGQQGLATVQESDADWPNTQRYQAVAYYNLGLALWRQARYAEAEKSLLAGLSLCRAINERFYEARSLASLSAVMYELGEDTRAEQFLAQGVLAFKQLGAFWGADDLSHLTQVTYALGKPLADLRALLENNLRRCREVGHPWMIVNALNFLGATLQRMDQAERVKAKRLLQESVALCRDLHTPASLVRALYQLGLTHTALSEYPAALACFREALEISLSANLTPFILETLLGLVTLLIKPEIFRPEHQEQLLTLLILVLNHPASARQSRDQVAGLLAELEKVGLAPEAVRAAKARVNRQTLVEMTKEILRDYP